MGNSFRNNNSSINIIFLLGCCLLYLINQYYLKGVTNNIILHYYFNDFLAMPLLLSYSNLILNLKNKNIYSLKGIYCFTAIASIWWEFVTPLYYSKSTMDLFDIFAYFIGATLYYFLNKIFNK